ncbi:SRPBCC family protein [Nocardia stercoris]|uniref:DUF1731 domain-containing protein n=1 Tax=Nocardia stercoris TaxID=2483361 RepID=A0A3M2KR61_9NOCA|nr:SRPBCC family protein [Nocardia stercoris]RMI28137.1 DUF1731 domain-containing protein [Nocardia stercoris]
MGSTTKYTQFIGVSAERLWAVLADPRRWPEWNPAVGAVTLRGEPGPGVAGDYLPARRISARIHGRLAKPFVLSAFEPGRRIALEQPEPAGVLRFTWTLAAVPGGTELTQELTVSGPSAPVWRRIAGEPLEFGSRVHFARLAQLAGIAPAPDALHVVIAGGSGALGRQVAADLVCRGQRVTVLTRRIDPTLPFAQVQWDGQSVGDWARVLSDRGDGELALINLAGKLVDCRPTEANVRELRSSRVDSTAALVAAARQLARPIDYWIQASTTAIWSDAGEIRCTETTPVPEPGLPQMTGVAVPWEREFTDAVARHRTILRTSIVLDPEAPALRRLSALTKAGLGGSVGNGRQWFSWIHLQDWLAIVRAALGLDPQVRLPDGILVAATDFPVRNRDLMAALRRHLHRPPAPPTPAAILAVGAVVLRTDPALGLTGRHATSEILGPAGFRFRYPTVDDALADLLPA